MALLALMCDVVALLEASLLTSGIKHSAIVMRPFAVGCKPSPSNSCRDFTHECTNHLPQQRLDSWGFGAVFTIVACLFTTCQ